jgi:hypothetical protein
MVIICPLILLSGAPEKVKRGKCKMSGGLSFLNIDVGDMSHCMFPYTLTFWKPRRRRPCIIKTLQFSVV